MATMNHEDVRIAVKIAHVDEDGTQYHDTLWYTPLEFEARSDAEIELEKQRRVSSWKTQIAEMSRRPQPSPTEEELVARKAVLEQELREIDSMLTAKRGR